MRNQSYTIIHRLYPTTPEGDPPTPTVRRVVFEQAPSGYGSGIETIGAHFDGESPLGDAAVAWFVNAMVKTGLMLPEGHDSVELELFLGNDEQTGVSGAGTLVLSAVISVDHAVGVEFSYGVAGGEQHGFLPMPDQYMPEENEDTKKRPDRFVVRKGDRLLAGRSYIEATPEGKGFRQPLALEMAYLVHALVFKSELLENKYPDSHTLSRVDTVALDA